MTPTPPHAFPARLGLLFAGLAATACAAFAGEPTQGSWLLPPATARWMSAGFRRLDAERQALREELGRLPDVIALESGERLGWRIYDYQTKPWRGLAWVEVDFGETVDFDAVALVPVNVDMPGHPGPGFGFPVRFRIEVFGDAGTPQVIADFTGADFPNPGAMPVFVRAPGARGRRVRVAITEPWRHREGMHACAFAELMVLQGTRNLATGRRGVTVRANDSRESAPAWSKANLIDGQSPLGAPMGARVSPEELVGHCWHSRLAGHPDALKWVQIDLGASQPLDEVRLVPARLPQRRHREGYGFPIRFRVEASESADFARAVVLADHTGAPYLNPGFNAVTVPAGITARYVRVTATELQHRTDGQYAFALAELQAYSGGKNIALGAPVQFLDNFEGSPNWRAAFLTDGARWMNRLGEWPDWLGGLSRRREVLGHLVTIEAQLVPLQHALTRIAGWSLIALLFAAALALLAGYYRLQLRRVREAEALRRQIAADLHDDLGSNLASITLLSELCLNAREPVPRADLAELHVLARETSDALRDATWFVRPGTHQPDQFLERLRATARRLLAGLEWTLEAEEFAEATAIDAQRHLLLALKEMLHNVVRHAGARHVRIQLSATQGSFRLAVTDDGRGMDPAAVAEGQGFASLRHRARLTGGATQIDSTPGRGTTVTFTGLLSAPAAAR